MKTDTIAAIATGMTNSGIGIIRISGSEAFSVIDRIFRKKRMEKSEENVLSGAETHTVHYGFICDGERVIDEVLVLIMRGPHSYTAEDTVEIDCHGGMLVMRRILETVIKYGARPAEPGEFTKRAFMNGRIDLSQAESVMDVIEAGNDFALESSIHQLQGSVRDKIREIREKVLYEIAFIESALDDPEHISLDGYAERLLKTIEDISSNVDKLLKSSENGELLKEGIKTVIVGKPNAGKSSLMNLLLGRERAIVTDVAGTTRDILEEHMNLDGITLNIADTAGIRETKDTVERIGVGRARESVSHADLILYVVDSSVELDENDRDIMELIQGRKAIILLNKSDLPVCISKENIEKEMNLLKNNMLKNNVLNDNVFDMSNNHISDMSQGLSSKKREKQYFVVVPVSAKEGIGLELLKDTIKDMFFQGEISFNDEVYITNVRHKTALQETRKSFEMVKESIRMGLPEDFYSIDLMNAYEKLGSIIGESVGENLVNEIFSKFCTGK